MSPSSSSIKSGASGSKKVNYDPGASRPASSAASSEVTTTSVNNYGPLKFSTTDDIVGGVQRLTQAFHEKQKSHSIQYRLNQLRNLYFAVKDNAELICESLQKDFYRSPSETKNYELSIGLNELLHTMASLHKWVKPDKVTDTGIALATNPVYVEKIPLGVVLIISPFNYPFFLSFSAVVGAIAAGNAVVLKQSEATPHFSQAFTEILTKALDPDLFLAVNGAIPETNTLLDQKFDKIMYTGSGTVGKIIAKKAAETLTPVLLELGGKSPAFVLDDVAKSDLPVIAKRLVWGRFMNAGQTCVAVDYVVVHQSVHDELVKEISRVINEEFYPGLDKNDPNYTHVIHDRAFSGLTDIIAKTKGKIVVGGESDKATRFIAPTVVDGVTWDDSTMAQEIFGPILPIITYKDLGETLKVIQSRFDTPLAQYIFTSKSTSRGRNPQLDQILRSIRSGATIINDVNMHVGLANAPFGGIGQSGTGAYHGEYSFRAFSHERTTIEQKLWNDFTFKSRYPPHNSKKDKLVEQASIPHNGKVWFGRTGNVKINGPSTLFSLWTGLAGVSALVYYLASG